MHVFSHRVLQKNTESSLISYLAKGTILFVLLVANTVHTSRSNYHTHFYNQAWNGLNMAQSPRKNNYSIQYSVWESAMNINMRTPTCCSRMPLPHESSKISEVPASLTRCSFRTCRWCSHLTGSWHTMMLEIAWIAQLRPTKIGTACCSSHNGMLIGRCQADLQLQQLWMFEVKQRVSYPNPSVCWIYWITFIENLDLFGIK